MKKLLPIPILTVGSLCALAISPVSSASAAINSAAADAITLRVAPDREVVFRRGPREVILEVEIIAKRPENNHRSPVNVSVVIDRSGSMEGAKIEKARQAACVALDRLDPDDYFSLVIYDNEAELLIPAERVGSQDHQETMKDRINRIRTRGSTALYAGVQLGAKQVRKFLDKERVNRVILLSDGLANVGPSRTTDLAELGRDLRGDGLSVTTIGLGDDFNEDLMTALAEASHANYYYVRDAEKLPGIFSDELGAAGTRVAGDVRIRIEAPAGVRLREMMGHPEISCKERSTEITIPELFGAERRLFHLRCSLDDTAAESLPLAAVALNYEDTASKRSQSQNQSATVRMTDDAQKSESSVQNEIAQNIAVLQNRLDKEAAVKLADAGKAKEASALLRQRAASNSAMPAPQQMPGVASENQKLEGLADELFSTGQLQNTSRKAAQWDNYQDKYQKKQSPKSTN